MVLTGEIETLHPHLPHLLLIQLYTGVGGVKYQFFHVCMAVSYYKWKQGQDIFTLLCVKQFGLLQQTRIPKIITRYCSISDKLVENTSTWLTMIGCVAKC